MVLQGRVQNGVVVLSGGISLPDGQEVTVITAASPGAKGHSILDISPVSLGPLLQSSKVDEDLLEEMLEGRA